MLISSGRSSWHIKTHISLGCVCEYSLHSGHMQCTKAFWLIGAKADNNAIRYKGERQVKSNWNFGENRSSGIAKKCPDEKKIRQKWYAKELQLTSKLRKNTF